MGFNPLPQGSPGEPWDPLPKEDREIGLDTKSRIFLKGFLEHQEIFRNFGDFLEKKRDFGGFLDDIIINSRFEESIKY